MLTNCPWFFCFSCGQLVLKQNHVCKNKKNKKKNNENNSENKDAVNEEEKESSISQAPQEINHIDSSKNLEDVYNEKNMCPKDQPSSISKIDEENEGGNVDLENKETISPEKHEGSPITNSKHQEKKISINEEENNQILDLISKTGTPLNTSLEAAF